MLFPRRGEHLWIIAASVMFVAGSSAFAGGLTPIETLGKELFFDTNLSSPAGQSCASCHSPQTGYTGPNSNINANGAVMFGAVSTRSGDRKPPTVAYSAFSPELQQHPNHPGYFGGLFWDGRVNTLEAQAEQPLLNPLEMNNPNEKAVVVKVRAAVYAPLFTTVFGHGALDLTNVNQSFANIVEALASYERSAEVNPFSSKFDAFLQGHAQLTPSEFNGYQLFQGQANCARCHSSHGGPPGGPGGGPGGHQGGPPSDPPLFTDFSYHNTGVPKNPKNPFYTMPKSINPAGRNFVDLGLGGFLNDPQQDGRMKVPTLRNVDLRPQSSFVKAYMHNGSFKSLKQVVHFYNTRVAGGFPPEFPQTVEHGEVGHLGLTDSQENDIVNFLKTLSDGFIK